VPSVELLLKVHGIDPTSQGEAAPLILAAGEGHSAVVKSFLARDNLNPICMEYALGYAASQAFTSLQVNVMKLLLARPDVDPNFARGFARTTPLNLGARFPDVVKLLLEQEGIDVNHQDDFGFTALIKATCCHSVESAKLLLERDDINVNIRDANGRGMTALHIPCCWKESQEIANLLLTLREP